MQVSFAFTRCVNGVGEGSGVKVAVGGGAVGVIVKVGEGVTVLVWVGWVTISGCWRNAKNTSTPPMDKNITRSKIATGKLRVTSGIRLGCRFLAGWAGFWAVPRSAPQTRQRVASAATFVPQVGQSFGMGDVSGLICPRIIPQGFVPKIRDRLMNPSHKNHKLVLNCII